MQPKGTITVVRKDGQHFSADVFLFGSQTTSAHHCESDWDVLLVPHQPIDSNTDLKGQPTQEWGLAIAWQLHGMQGEGLHGNTLEDAVRQQLGSPPDADLDLFLAVTGNGAPAVRLGSWDDHFATYLDGLSASTDPEMLAYRAERATIKARLRGQKLTN
jgi:hypothetical protein